MDSPAGEDTNPVKEVKIINLPEVLPGTPGHLIGRVKVGEILQVHRIKHHPVITPFKYNIVPVQLPAPVIYHFFESLRLDTIPGDMETVVELPVPVVSRNAVGAGSHQEEITIRTPGLVEFLPDHLEILPHILPVNQPTHLRPHPGVLVEKTVRVSLDGVPQVYQVSIDVGADIPVHLMILGFEELEEDRASPAERLIICANVIREVGYYLFTLNPFTSHPLYYRLKIHNLTI